VVGRADRKAATPLRSLGTDDRLPEQLLDGTSGVRGDFHALVLWEPGGEIPPGHPAGTVPPDELPTCGARASRAYRSNRYPGGLRKGTATATPEGSRLDEHPASYLSTA
jgi:hypothetical protein